MDGFAEFWAHYPRHVAKLAAEKAYQKARIVATEEEILAGLDAYCRHLPRETQFIAHAATWLRAGRWMDEYDAPVKRLGTASDWFSECQELHGGACGCRWDHDWKMRERA
jgi:hypothetical protein